MPEPSLLERLKQRKIIQWAFAYLAGAFVVFQLLDALATPLSLTTTIQRGILAVVVVGFFITLVLAWYHGEKGRQRVSGPELLLIALLLGIAGGGLLLLRDSEANSEVESGIASAGTQTNEDPRPSIIVLACRNISPDPADAYVAEGLHEAILHKLVGISGLRSLGRETANWYRDNPKLSAEIAAEQGLDFVGECSIRKYRDEDRIFVTFQLLDADGAHVWSEEYDRDLSAEAESEIQADVARQVAERVQAGLTQDERQALDARPTESLEAYEAYQQGRYFYFRLGAEDATRAMEHFKRAIELDPSYSNAYVGLSDAYRIFWWYSPNLDPIPVRDSARVLLERALALDSQNPEALASVATFKLHWEWDLPGAKAAIERALSLNPNDYRVSSWYANILGYISGVEPALVQQRRVLSMDPFNAGAVADLGLYLRYLGRLDEAIARYVASLEIDPANPIVRTGLGWVYLESGRINEALAEFEALEFEEFNVAGGLTRAYVQLGQRDEALRVYRELLALANQQRISSLSLAFALRPLDETRAFDLLAQAMEEEDPHLLETMRWGWWSYREHPRYREILNSMGLDFEGDRFVEYRGGR